MFSFVARACGCAGDRPGNAGSRPWLNFGTVANMLLFAATAAAPNPAFSSAIASAASLVIFALSFGLFRFFPKYFYEMKFDGGHLLGILVIIAGVFLLARSQ